MQFKSIESKCSVIVVITSCVDYRTAAKLLVRWRSRRLRTIERTAAWRRSFSVDEDKVKECGS